jgi:predicted membrane protein
VALSAVGTFLSIRFGDELMDVLHHRDRAFFHAHHFKHELILLVFFVAVLFGYYRLIASLGIEAVVHG